jgi:hypothetical protein
MQALNRVLWRRIFCCFQRGEELAKAVGQRRSHHAAQRIPEIPSDQVERFFRVPWHCAFLQRASAFDMADVRQIIRVT